MKPDREALVSLEAILTDDMRAIREHEAKIMRAKAGLEETPPDEDRMTTVAYALHNIYNALENGLEQISATFENHIIQREHWHRELLTKMTLEMRGIRPAVLSAHAHRTARELLSFRHMFRHAYDLELDPEKLARRVAEWLAGREELLVSLEGFRAWLRAQSEHRAE